MYNSPFRNKSIDKANSTGKATTSNAMMSAGPGDPPKKGTATTVTSEDKLNLLVEGFESARASHLSAAGADIEGRDKMRKYAEAIKKQPGGVQKFQEMTGGVGKGSETGKKVTLSDVAKMKGVTETEAAGDLRRQQIKVSKSKKSKD